jgi:hypothetical protein
MFAARKHIAATMAAIQLAGLLLELRTKNCFSSTLRLDNWHGSIRQAREKYARPSRVLGYVLVVAIEVVVGCQLCVQRMY